MCMAILPRHNDGTRAVEVSDAAARVKHDSIGQASGLIAPLQHAIAAGSFCLVRGSADLHYMCIRLSEQQIFARPT